MVGKLSVSQVAFSILYFRLRNSYNLHVILTWRLVQKFLHCWNRKTTRRPIPRKTSWRKRKCQRTKNVKKTVTSMWQSAVFPYPYPYTVRKAAQLSNKSWSFRSALLIHTVSTNLSRSTYFSRIFFWSRWSHLQRNSIFITFVLFALTQGFT